MNLSLASDLNNQMYLLTHRAPLHDAVKELSHSITFTSDRISAFRQLLRLTSTMTAEAATLSPACLAYYFAATETRWISMFAHICNVTLSPTSANDVALDPSHEEKTVGLQLLKSVLLLWPPSCQWQSSNVLMPRVFTAAASARNTSSVPRLELQTLRLTVVDVVLAFACAAKRCSCYRRKEEKNVNEKKVNEKNDCDDVPGARSGTELNMLPELRDLVHQTFTKLSWCCSFTLDQSGVHEPNEIKKQNRKIDACLTWFEELECCGLRILAGFQNADW
jgi:hypothetical protein